MRRKRCPFGSLLDTLTLYHSKKKKKKNNQGLQGGSGKYNQEIRGEGVAQIGSLNIGVAQIGSLNIGRISMQKKMEMKKVDLTCCYWEMQTKAMLSTGPL